MDTVTLFQKFGLALGLGLLVGLQRERSASLLAGFRTFPLVTMLGTLLGVISAKDGWALSAAGLLGVAVLIAIGNWKKSLAGNSDPGMTTEAALLMMYGLGLFIASGPAGVAVVVGAAVASLLYLKPQLHGLARNIDENDFRGIMQFVAIALVILPMTPDLELGPYGMLNPRRIWWVVVLITGISLGGYLLYKTCPPGSGAIAAGIFGGLISSTATTVSFARRTKTDATGTPGAALAIMLASTVVFARVLVLVAVAARAHLQEFGPPILVMLGVMLAVCSAMWIQVRGKGAELPEQTNPTELKTALVFTVLFTVVLIATAAARDYFGTRGLFAVAILSGLTDMDAITISTAQMAEKGHVASGIAWRVVLAAALSNIVFKTVTVASLGSRELLRRVVCGFGVAIAMSLVLLVVWP
jgi:uncharacterized membrane protein (DUF4010 family)